MRKSIFILLITLVTVSCKQEEKKTDVAIAFDEKSVLEQQQQHENERMRFKVLSPKVERASVFITFEEALDKFGEDSYEKLYPLVIERSIPEIQESVASGEITYREICLVYLWRMRKYEGDAETSLHTVISLNPDILKQAAEKDRMREERGEVSYASIYGLPIMLKDNIGTEGMPTTAGAVALKDNFAGDAFIVRQLKEAGALILGKVNLSEWAYYFCEGCPLGYSAIGGQTLNPYGPMVFETGGSSSGSGVAVAANYAVAAVGTETSGSILSPSSQNSVVGLKPTVGLLSRSGIVPISSTLDTPGPMTRNVIDAAIMLNAMTGEDMNDGFSFTTDEDYVAGLSDVTLKGKRFGAFNSLVESDSIYAATLDKIREAGAEVIMFDPPEDVNLNGFLTLLNIDMKYDLPKYLESTASNEVGLRSIQQIVAFNEKDSLIRAPYNQDIFKGILADSTTTEQLEVIKQNLKENGRKFFNVPMETHDLDAVLSINNYHASYAAVAHYPALTVPMGYKTSGEPVSLTFIAASREEAKLFRLAYAFEQLTGVRKTPANYK
ncbi:amidase family protein [Robertkochia aurantiaca]|uniref:amidase family protein n=1 Tax=Robertkochia aurantiaca TaxID=2873700 RepID=UPI001CCD5DD7|nr:amidase family protein [Robertkochia sp. 3YJGBD-33]